MNVWYELFPKIFNMSVTASIIILAVLAVRLLLRKAPRVFSYLLWGVVLFRLLCPVSLPSRLSVFNMAAAVTELSRQTMPEIPVPPWSESEPFPTDIVYTTYPSVPFPVSAISETANATLSQGNEVRTADVAATPVSVLTWIWLFGMGILLLYSLISYIKLKHRIRCSMPLRDNIYLADYIASPFTAGLLRPRIYLPSALKEQEREYIILHEQHHIRRRDHIIKFFAFTALCIHWFNPLVWAAFILAGKDMEMSCDEAVMKKMDHDIRAEYSVSLLQLATGKRIFAASPLAFGEGNPKSRIQNVMNYKKPSFRAVVLAAAACIIVAVALLTNPHTKDISSADSTIGNSGNEPSDSTIANSEKEPSNSTIANSGNVPSDSEAPENEVQWAVRPSITLDNITYWEDIMPVETLPYGYECAGSLRADQVSDPYLKGHEYYTVPGDNNMIYVYQECGTRIDDSTVDSTKRQWAYIRWINKDIYPSSSEASPASTLAAAIQRAIISHNTSDSTADADFACATFFNIEAASSNADKEESSSIITRYGQALYQEYHFSEKAIETTASRYTPVVLTFEQDENGYTLKEYWEPREGTFFEEDIQKKFPLPLIKEARNSQKYFLSLQQFCYDKAIRYNSLDSDKFIETLFASICSSPKSSSHSEDYRKAHEKEYSELLYYRDYTVRYCFQHFEEGLRSGKKETGRKEQIMSQVCTDLIKECGYSQLGPAEELEGYEWYEALKAHGGNILDEIYQCYFVFR